MGKLDICFSKITRAFRYDNNVKNLCNIRFQFIDFVYNE
jgi:hypothetical protein